MRQVWRLLPVLAVLTVSAWTCAGEDIGATVRKEVDNYLATRGAGAAGEGTVSVGFGKLKLSGLLQVWFQYTQNDKEGYAAWDSENDVFAPTYNEMNDNDTFMIRRAEIALDGQITPEVSYRIMIDPARAGRAAQLKQNADDDYYLVTNGEYTSSILQDAYINLNFIKWHTVRVGQFKRPIGREANLYSGRLPLPERAMLSNGDTNPLSGDARDAGLMVVGEYKETVVDWFTWYFGIFNGAGAFDFSLQNRANDNDEFDFCERLEVRLFGKQGAFLRDSQIGDLGLGFSRLDGKQGENMVDAVGCAANSGRYFRATWHYTMGFDLEYRYKFKELGEVWLMSEWLEGTTHRPLPEMFIDRDDLDDAAQRVRGPKLHGWYAMLGYRIGGTGNVHVDRLEPVFRFEQWTNVVTSGMTDDTRGHAHAFTTTVWTIGLNYYIKGNNAKIQAAYDFVDNPNRDYWRETWCLKEHSNDRFRLAFQVSF